MSTRLPDRSERQLMRHAADRLSVLWYAGYDLDEPLPDHSSLTRIRERYGVNVFRRFFEAIVEQCQAAGLVWGKELYFDGTKVEANASLDSVKPRFAVEAHLATLFGAQAQEAGDESDQDRSQEEAAFSGQGSPEAPKPLPTALSQEEQEALAQHNEERHDWIEQRGAQDRSVTGRSYQRMADLRVSTTDPDATLMLTKQGADMGYHTHYVVDGGKARIILNVLVTPSEVMDNQPMLDLLWRFRLRRLWRVNCEALMIAAGQNLKRLLKKRGWGRRPFPTEAMCASFWGLLREVLVLMLEKRWFLVPIGRVFSRLRAPPVSLCR